MSRSMADNRRFIMRPIAHQFQQFRIGKNASTTLKFTHMCMIGSIVRLELFCVGDVGGLVPRRVACGREGT